MPNTEVMSSETMSILYVEDNDDNMYMLSRRLSRRGFLVHEARDGTTGFNMAKSLKPVLIIMDLVLPDIDGLEVVRQIRAEESISDTPVIALSASAFTEDRNAAFVAGCDDFETKPVNFERLVNKIEKLLLNVRETPRETLK